MTLLISIFAFLIAIGIIVSFHEFGHFWVARRLGVKVLRYSIGFGKPIWLRSGNDGTEYAIAMIPLGGYVKMLDEREAPVDSQDLDRAFNRQSLSVRTAIVAAGPLFNFILALILYCLMFIVGVSGVKPVVGEVLPDGVAERAGVVSGDRFVEVAGKQVRSWRQTLFALLDASFEKQEFVVTTARQGVGEVDLVFDISDINMLQDNDLLNQLGIRPQRFELEAVIGKVVPDTGADRAHLRAGDQVVSFAGADVANWSSLVRMVVASPGQELGVGIIRDGKYREEIITIGQLRQDDRSVGYMGVLPRSPAPEDIKRHQSFVSYGVLESLVLAFEKTWEMTVLTVRVMQRLLMGDASLNNISGPVGIAEYAGISLLQGFGAFLGLLAVLSISIGILNLLPVPLLDGGHLFYYLIEFIKGSPVSMQGQALGHWIGIFMLGCLMLVALYNDISRLID